MLLECFERSKSNEGLKCNSFEVFPGLPAYPKLGCHMSFMQNCIILKLLVWIVSAIKMEIEEKMDLNVMIFVHNFFVDVI